MSLPHQNQYVVRRLKSALSTVHEQIRLCKRQRKPPSKDLVDAFLRLLQELDRLENQPARKEVAEFRARLEAVERRIQAMDAAKAMGTALRGL